MNRDFCVKKIVPTSHTFARVLRDALMVRRNETGNTRRVQLVEESSCSRHFSVLNQTKAYLLWSGKRGGGRGVPLKRQETTRFSKWLDIYAQFVNQSIPIIGPIYTKRIDGHTTEKLK